MDHLQIRADIIEDIFGNSIFNRNNNEVLVFCPNGCHPTKKKLSINVEKNTGKCWICSNQRGSIFYFLNKYANKKQKNDYKKTLDFKIDSFFKKEVNLSLPEDYEFILSAEETPLGRISIIWLKSKGISKKTMLHYKIGVCHEGFYKDRIIFPSFSFDGNLNYFISRRVDKNPYQKYLDCTGVSKKDIIFNEIYIDWSSPLILVENVRTPLVHKKIKNIVPILGSDNINKRSKIFRDIVTSGIDKVYICLDPDAQKKSIQISENFRRFGVDSYNVFLDRQVDEVKTETFLKAIHQSKPFSKDSFLIEKVMNL